MNICHSIHQIRGFLILEVTVFCVACSGVTEITNSDEGILSIRTSISSRHATTTDLHSDFTEGDTIGLFVDEANASVWQLTGTKWETAGICRWPDLTAEHRFDAVHPYFADNISPTAIPLPSLHSQTGSLNDLCIHDVLVAHTTQKYTEGTTINLCFIHVRSLIIVTLSTPPSNVCTVTGLQLTGDSLATPGTYDLTTRQITYQTDSNQKEVMIQCQPSVQATDTYYMIVNGNTVLQQLSVTWKDAEQQAHTAIGLLSLTVATGKRHTLRVTLANDALQITGASISDWDEGEEMDIIIHNQ